MEQAHIEKEYKVMIDKEVYSKLLKDLDITPFVQINHYYKTNRKDCAMRIREKDGKYIFTLKQKGDGFKYEYEFEILNNSLNHKEVKEILDKFKIKETKYLGYMTTERSVKNMKYGELCIDKSTYNGVVDYELEYELYDHKIDKYDDFVELLNKYSIAFIKANKSKLKRFIDTL